MLSFRPLDRQTNTTRLFNTKRELAQRESEITIVKPTVILCYTGFRYLTTVDEICIYVKRNE